MHRAILQIGIATVLLCGTVVYHPVVIEIEAGECTLLAFVFFFELVGAPAITGVFEIVQVVVIPDAAVFVRAYHAIAVIDSTHIYTIAHFAVMSIEPSMPPLSAFWSVGNLPIL